MYLVLLCLVGCGGGASDSSMEGGSPAIDGGSEGDNSNPDSLPDPDPDPDPDAGETVDNDDVLQASACVAIEAVNFDQFSGINGFANATTDTKLGLSALQVADRLATAAAIQTYGGDSANVIFKLHTMQESDGESSYSVKVNGALVGQVQNTRIHGTEIADYSLQTHVVNNQFFAINTGDEIQVEFTNATNGLVVEGETSATSRGRWHSLELCTNGDPVVLEPEVIEPIVIEPIEPATGNCEINGNLHTYDRVELLCNGLAATESEAATFTDYRFNVTFSKGEESIVVRGHFAADAQAADSGATEGDTWRAYFMPPSAGEWGYNVSFRSGDNIAVSAEANTGTPVASLDGKQGTFTITEGSFSAPDMRARGLLQHKPGERYLRFSKDNTVFIQAGLDSPENIFGYSGFDNTTKYFSAASCKGILHDFEPHLSDWQTGDPTWNNGKGKSLIGLVNYLSGRGVNSVYIMANTVQGDGCDAHPWVNYNDTGTEKTFDVSKLDQWERVLQFMQQKGMLIHIITQEQENDQLLNGGELGLERKLYYRELISRFAHHPALQWNLGEENGNTLDQQKSFAAFIKQTDPYDHAVLMHTYPGEHDLYEGLLGDINFDGPTFQYGGIPNSTSNLENVYEKANTWLQKSADAGHSWVVTFTEASGANAPQPNTAVEKRQRVFWMWASVMSGGAGFEWYLKNPGAGHAYDLAVEDLREFDEFWQQSGYLATFFRDILQRELNINLQTLMVANDVTETDSDWVLAKEGEAYVIYLRDGGTSDITLPDNKVYQVIWFNPRTGERYQGDTLQGQGSVPLGVAPNENTLDWALVVYPIADAPQPSGGYVEKNGLVVMEAENTPSHLDLWQQLTEVDGYTGDGYIQFNGNEVTNGPATSPLTYQFTVNTAGNYYLHLRCARETIGDRTDVANDAFIRLEGDFESGAAETPLNYLTTDSKYFGGADNRFVWATGNRLDRDHAKWPVVYNLKAGETYTFTMSGRSKLFKVDRIVFRHESVTKQVAESINNEETLGNL